MIRELERTKPLAKVPATAGTWIQITFTLDPEHYRVLWERADDLHRTIPGFVRESVISFLGEINNASPKTTFLRK